MILYSRKALSLPALPVLLGLVTCLLLAWPLRADTTSRLLTLDPFQLTTDPDNPDPTCIDYRCGWGEPGVTAEHDIVALYQRDGDGCTAYRVDLLDLPDRPHLDLYLALQQDGDGLASAEVDGVELNTGNDGTGGDGVAWNVLVRVRCGNGSCSVKTWRGNSTVDPHVEPLQELAPALRVDTQLDYVEVELCPSPLETGRAEQRLMALSAEPNGEILDRSPAVGPAADASERAKLVLVFGNLFHGFGAAAYEWYDGCFPDRRRSCGGTSPGGGRYLLDAAERHGIPVVVPDLHMDVLPGLELLGIAERLRKLSAEGLLDLPDTLTYGYFMPWQPPEVDEKAIELARKLRHQLLGSSQATSLFSPYEARVQVDDLVTLANSGYEAISGLGYYRHWFPDGGSGREMVEDSKKIQSVTVQWQDENGDHSINTKVLFVPEQQGIDTDSRWARDYVAGASEGDYWSIGTDFHDAVYAMMLGTDDGLHLYWRRALLDQAVDPDQHKYFDIGADIQLTPMLFPEVLERDFAWLASHPWIEVVTFSDLLERAKEEPDWFSEKMIKRKSKAAHLIQPQCYEWDYNTYFELFYDGDDEAGERWSCLVPCGTSIEGYADYRPWVEPGTEASVKMGSFGANDTVVGKTLEALLAAPEESTLSDLAWLSYFVTIAEQTQHKVHAGENLVCPQEECDGSCSTEHFYPMDMPPAGTDGGAHLSTTAKLRANFLGQAGKLAAAAKWARCVAERSYEDCVISVGLQGETCQVSLQPVDGMAKECDLDFDREPEALLANRQVLAIFEDDGGRLEYAFLYDEDAGGIQAVGPFSQHYGLLEPPWECGGADYTDWGCVQDPGTPCCYEQGEAALTSLTESGGGVWGGAFAEVLKTKPGGLVEKLFAEVYEQQVGDRSVGFQKTGNDGGSVTKTFTLAGDALTASYETAGFGPDLVLELGFGLPVDMASMLRRDAWFMVSKEGPGDTSLGWRAGRARATVEWTESGLWANNSCSYTESAVRELNEAPPGTPLEWRCGNALWFPYNSLALAVEPGTTSGFSIQLRLGPVSEEVRDTALVLDLSGSMEGAACPDCRPKHVVLKEAAQICLGILGAVGGADDGLVLSVFRTAASAQRWSAAQSGIEAAIDALKGEQPGGLTAMGPGLEEAIGALEGAERRRSMLLLTDGMQNVDPQVVERDGGLWVGDDQDAIDLVDAGIPISTIAIGPQSHPSYELLEKLASATGGEYAVTQAPDDELRELFVRALVGNPDLRLHLDAYRRGRLGGAGTVESVHLAEGVRRAVFELSWDRTLERPLELQVRKDGRDVTALPRLSSRGGDFYAVYAVDLSAATADGEIDAAGEWQVSVHGPQGAAYELAVVTRGGGFGYELTLPRDRLRVGEPIEPVVRLAVDGRPLSGARVRGRVLRPQVGVGTVLSQTPTPDLSRLPTDAGERGAERKLSALAAQPDVWRQLQWVTSDWFTLTDRGDGTYSGTFRGTRRPGAYRVEVVVESDSAVPGGLRREASRTVLVEIGGLDFERSEVSLVWPHTVTDLAPVRLTLRPRDAADNFLGPGYADRLVVEPQPGDVERIEDLLDGTYRVTLRGVSRDGTLRIRFADEALYSGSITDLLQPRRFSLGLAAGWSDPLAGFAPGVDGDVATEASLEYRLDDRFSVGAFVGSYRLDPGPDVVGGALYLRRYKPLSASRLVAEVGAGWFDPEQVDGAAGVVFGAGADRALAPRWRGEVGCRFGHLFNTGDDLELLTCRVGFRTAI